MPAAPWAVAGQAWVSRLSLKREGGEGGRRPQRPAGEATAVAAGGVAAAVAAGEQTARACMYMQSVPYGLAVIGGCG